MSVSPDESHRVDPSYPLHPSVADKLAKQYVDFYNEHLINAPPVHHLPIAESRARNIQLPGPSKPLPCSISDLLIPRQATSGPEIWIRCFCPHDEPPTTGWPVMLYYHGGGWAFGDIDSENVVCTNLCVRSNCMVITTDYRLAPEYPYPAAIEDSWETLLWTVSQGAQQLHLDVGRVVVGGASAGANLAASLAQKIVDWPDLQQQLSLKGQLLCVPVLDNSDAATVENNPTYRMYEHTAALPAAKMLWYRNHYLPDPGMRLQPAASPFLYQGDLGKLPPTIILVGEIDILRHEGEQYAEKLRNAGVEVHLEIMIGMPHPFLAMDEVLDEGRRAVTILCEALAKMVQ